MNEIEQILFKLIFACIVIMQINLVYAQPASINQDSIITNFSIRNPIPVYDYSSCVENSNNVLANCLANVENTTQTFPNPVLNQQLCYAKQESTIRTLCVCYLKDPPQICFDLNTRNALQCDINAKAYALTCRIGGNNKLLCDQAYKAAYRICMMTLLPIAINQEPLA